MKLSAWSWIGYAWIIAALIFWQYRGYDSIILGMLILGGILLLRDVILHYFGKEKK